MKELTKADLIDIAKIIKQEKNRLETAKNSLNREITIVYSGCLIEQSRIDKLQEYYQKIGREIINMEG